MMNNKGQAWIILILNIITLIMLLGVLTYIILNQQSQEPVNNICQKCGYNETTDKVMLLPFSVFPVVDKLECDNKYIVDVFYESKTDKWGKTTSDFNKPYARSC